MLLKAQRILYEVQRIQQSNLEQNVAIVQLEEVIDRQLYLNNPLIPAHILNKVLRDLQDHIADKAALLGLNSDFTLKDPARQFNGLHWDFFDSIGSMVKSFIRNSLSQL